MPLSAAEQMQLQTLLKKASTSTEADSHSCAGSDGGFSLIPDGTQGAMTDGSKRREGSPVDEPESKRGGYVHPYVSDGHNVLSLPPGVMTGSISAIEPTFVSKSFDPPELQVTLPPKVPNMDTWGRTIITWGQFKGCNLSYEELYLRTDEKSVGYKKWCMARLNSAEGRLLDLVRYMHRRDLELASSSTSQSPVIPGTSEVRKYK